jgi:hypothetical protein
MPKKRGKQGSGFSSKRCLVRSKLQKSPGNTRQDPVLVEVEAVLKAIDEVVIADEVDEVNEEDVEVVKEDEGNQDEIVDEKDDCTDEGSDPDEAPRAPYSEAELNAFSDIVKTCGNNLSNFEKLGRNIKETLYDEEKEEWSALDAARQDGDTVLEVMRKMYGKQTKKMRAAIRDIAHLEKLAQTSFDTTIDVLNRKPLFSTGRLIEFMDARASFDGKRIEELEDVLGKLELENQGLKALQWEYRRLLNFT